MGQTTQELMATIAGVIEAYIQKETRTRLLAAAQALGETTGADEQPVRLLPRKRKDPEYRTRVLAEVAAGKLSSTAIAKREGISPSTISDWKRARDAQKAKHGNRHPAADKRRLLAELATGKISTRAMAKREHLHPSLLSYWKRQLGMTKTKPIPGAAEKKRKHRTWTPELRKQILEEIDEAKKNSDPIRLVYKRHDVDGSVVRMWAKQAVRS